MHGHSPGSALLVNAEVDSMGGVVDGGISLDTKTSPRRAAIEKAQAELRQEFDVREERRRELEFLEKGGNPLDFKLGPATSISVQSTSLTDQLGEQYVVSEAKGSFALAASPHGDSVDSSGRPGPTPARDPNSADNLLLLDGENDVVNADRNSMHPSKRSKIAQSVQSSQLDGSLNAKESEDSTVFRLGKSQAYARRNRSRSNRDSGHGNATDLGQSGHGNGTSLVVPSSRHDSRDAKEPLSDSQKEKEPTGSSICHLKTMSLNGNAVVRTPASENQLDMEVDAVQAPETSAGHMKVGDPEKGLDTEDRNQNKSSQVGLEKDSSAAALAHQKEEQVQFSPEYRDADAKEKLEKHANADQTNGCSFLDTNANITLSPIQNKENGFFSPKGVDSESSSLDRFATGDQCLTLRKGNGSSLENSTEFMTAQLTPPVNNEVKETKDPITVELNVVRKDDHETTEVKMEEENDRGRCDLQTEAESIGQLSSKSDRKLDTSLCDESNSRKASLGLQARSPSRLVLSNGNVVDAVSSEKESTTTACEAYNTLVNKLKNQADEDGILEKARIIEANRKRLGELSVSGFHSEKCKKSHWDFVLEEMAWLANDFMQERLWKTTAAAHMSQWVAFGGFKKFNEENLHRKQKKVARTLAKAIIQFWKSAEVLFSVNSSDDCNAAVSDSQKGHVLEAIKDKDNATIVQQTSNSSEEQKSGQENLAIQGYAVRFLKYISSCSDQPVQAEAPTTPDRISDSGILEISWEDQLSEESLIYTLPAGAMEDYRKSVESLWAEYEKIGDSAQQEELEVSLRDSVSDYGAQDNPYEEEGETGSYYLPRGYEGFKPSKFVQKKKKNLQRSYTARSYDVAHELPYRHSLENRLGSKQVSMGKRPSSALNVGSIPIKRVRTAARQRVVGPFIVGGNSGAQVASKTDASSGDTSSLQDDQSSLHGGSQLRKNSEVESTGEFGKQFPFDGADTSPKAKKKKKSKHVLYRNSLNTAESGGFVMSGHGSTFDQTFLDMAQHEQRDLSKRKLENHQFESNGSIGIYGPHAKKPKLLKQVSEASPETLGPINGSLPSPVASHISNMSNPNKLIRMIANRAPGRKAKGLKIISTTPSGSGSPWSNLEDQALVVLVHDMGPNWELVSDAMNSSLHFKCTFRKPKECKERHKVLMDQNSGDGADSVEDSGSSQPYPSTLPGIPKSCVGGGTLHQGSARQLFQHLQGPMEEDMLKAHFEKIILIGKQLHTRRIKNDNQEGKQLTPVHSSHFHSLSQVCSNNSNAIPTPLDFCDAPASSPDVLALGYQGSHPNSLAVPNNQGSMGTMLPTSGASPMIQGTSGMVLGNGVSASPAAINPSPRDAHRFGVPRSTSLPMDEQQRLQQYSQMISGRNIAQPAMTTSGAMQVGNDRGVRMLPGGNGVGMMCSMNRSIGMPRPGFQGMGSPGMLNMVSSGGMISSSGVGMPSPVNLHTGPISGQANSMLRPRDTLAMTRPGQNSEDQRHLMMQELQIQVPQANGQSVSTHFNSLSTPYTNQTVPPPVQNFPAQHPPQHQMAQQPHVLNSPHHSHLQGSNSSSPQQQAYAFRLAKERHLQQRLMHQQPHQFTSTPSVPQSQHPISPVQNGSPASGSPASLPHSNTQHPLNPSSSPMNPIPSQVQAKHTHSLSRNPPPTGTLSNQMLKQRQRQQQLQQQQQQQQQLRQQQQQQQQQRSHPQSRQQSHPQQQPKHVKGLGRGSSVIMHQNLTVDPSHVNGLSPGSQVSEKGEPAMHLMQSQGLYSGGVSGSSLVQPGKQLSPQLSNPSTQQQKLFPRATQKQHPQIPSHMDGNNQGQVPQVTSNQTLLPTQQTVPSSPLPRQASLAQQSVQRMHPQSGRQSASSDTSVQGPTDQVQINQMGPNSGVSQCMDAPGIGHLVSSSATSSSQWKAEPSLYDTSSPVVQLTSVGNSPQTSSTGSELGPTPIQPMVQRQLSGGTVPSHGNNIGGQWQQQSQTPPQQQQTQQQQQQQQQRHAQGNLYARTSNSGQG